MSEKFNLKWNAFQSNVSRTFSLLRSEEEFFDVSLVAADQKMMSAHKLVLSACSPYFKHILTQNKHSHPLLCLDGVSSGELQCVLDYIYQGEVQVYKDQLDRFLEVAQRLKLEGLINPDKPQSESSSPPIASDPLSVDRKAKIEKIEFENQKAENFPELKLGHFLSTTMEDILEQEPENIPKQELGNLPEEKQQSKPRRKSTSYFANANNFSSTDEIDKKLSEYIIRGEDGLYSCGYCGKSGVKTKQNLVYHLETHIENLSHPCPNCEKTFRNRSSLSQHKAIHRV